MSKFRTRESIEQCIKGGKILNFFAINPKGRLVGFTKKRMQIDFSLPIYAVAAIAKAYKANKSKNYSEEQPQTKKICTNYCGARKFPP